MTCPQPDPRTLAVTAVARAIAATAEDGVTKGWRDQGPRTDHGLYDVALTDFYSPKVRAALRARWTDADIRAAIITGRQYVPMVKAARTAGAADSPHRAAIIAAVTSVLASTGTTSALRRVLTWIRLDAWTTGRHVADTQIGRLPRPRKPVAAPEPAAPPIQPPPPPQAPTGTAGDPGDGDKPALPEFTTPDWHHTPDTGTGGTDGVTLTIDWDNWEPGWPEAAAHTAHGELARALDDLDITLDRIDRTTLDRVGDEIARGLLDGDPVDRIARGVDRIIDDPARALTIAHTETARAQVAATLDRYREEGFRSFEWIASDGACPACAAMEASNPHPMGTPAPPKHPRCRCALSVAVDDME